jgi:glucose-6-phosphate dehydrogenase assembly protein OpcA
MMNRIRRRAAPRGQALVEYMSVVTVLLLGAMVSFAAWPFTRLFFEALQSYIDLFFYALNVAVG